MKIKWLGVLLILTSGIISCTGAGRFGFARDGYCFNDRDGSDGPTFDPIPLELDDRNYRKATFAPDLTDTPQVEENLQMEEPLVANNPDNPDPRFIQIVSPITDEDLEVNESQPTEWLSFFASSRYSQGGINDRIEDVKRKEKESAEKWRREMAKVYPLTAGEYQYVGAEIYTTERLPQLVSQNKDRRIYLSHVKNKEGDFVFGNNCVSNMPKSGGFAPINAEALTGFRVIGNEVFNDSVSSYTIKFEDLKIKASFSKNEKPAFSSPKEYLGKSEVKYQLYKLVDPGALSYTHELRSYQEQGSTKIYTRTFYKLVPLENAEDIDPSELEL